jgi:hypothetical protein
MTAGKTYPSNALLICDESTGPNDQSGSQNQII